MCENLLTRIAADENLHMIFYRNLMDAALKIAPDQAIIAILDVVKNFEMHGRKHPRLPVQGRRDGCRGHL